MADQVLVAPPGITRPDQFAERNTQRMPQPMMGPRPSLIVGGPAYFTPEGYQAPVQPEQSFMPTGGRPNLIRDSFNRPLPPMRAPAPAPAPQPAPAPAPTQTGGVGDPARYQASQEPAPTPPQSYIDVDGNLQFGEPPSFTMGQEDSNTSAPSQGPDRGSASPNYTPPPPAPEPKTAYEIAMAEYSPTGMSNEQLKISMDAGMAIPKADYPDFETYLASLSAPVSTPEPEFVPPPTMPEPNGFFPGVTPDFSNLDFSGLSDLNLEDMDFSNLPNYQMPAPTMPAPQAQAPAPVYTPPPSQIPMQGMMDDYDFGNPNLRNMGRSGPRR